MSFFRKAGDRLLINLGTRLERVRGRVGSALLPSFGSAGEGLIIQPPFETANPDRIHFGKDVKIGANSVIKATTRFPGSWLRHPDGKHVSQEFSPTITIGDRVTATWALQLVAFERITIEDDVMFAGNIYVSDGQHGSSRGDVPYKYQGVEDVSPIRIGRGSWIGQNAVILPGVTIGENSVIGANSVVNTDIPANSLAVGAPARVVRSWDPARQAWRRPGVPTEETQKVGR